MTAHAAAPPISSAPGTPSLWSILRDGLRGAPTRLRRSALIAILAWVALIVGQAFDSASHPGTPAIAEFLSALLASAGGVILGLAALLQADAERRTLVARQGSDAERFRRILLALPALALAAAALLSGAVTLMLMRALLGTPVAFVIIMTAIMGMTLFFAAATMMRATRTLYSHVRAEADAAALARIDAGKAQLAALQARMNPHFLFNALNTIAALVRSDPDAAERVTEQLSGVLRRTLERSAHETSTIGEEVDYVCEWLAVEQARLGDRLRVEWGVDPSLRATTLPPLVLQPLIENALHHGIGGRLEGGTIRIVVQRRAEGIVLSVQDDGDGFPPAHVERTGLGNLRQRLTAVYGSRATLSIDRAAVGGHVTVTVPFITTG